MRADRLLSTLRLLQVHGRLTARELSAHLEVSERTVLRDMDALTTAGIPVYAQRGSGGGWMLPDWYRAELPGLADAEVRALFLARPNAILDDLGLREASDTALHKLRAALPSAERRGAEHASQRLYVDSSGWRRSKDDVPLLPVIQEAVWRDRRLALRYSKADGTTVERVVDPLGLVVKGHIWYVVAATAGELPTYRVSRVNAAVVSDERFVRPPDFDLAGWWTHSAATFASRLPMFRVSVRISPDVLGQLERPGGYMRVVGRRTPDADGWSLLDLLFEDRRDACGWLLSMGTSVRISGPGELRDDIVDLAESVLHMYSEEGYRADRIELATAPLSDNPTVGFSGAAVR